MLKGHKYRLNPTLNAICFAFARHRRVRTKKQIPAFCVFSGLVRCIKSVHLLYQKRTDSYIAYNYCIVNHLDFNPACNWKQPWRNFPIFYC